MHIFLVYSGGITAAVEPPIDGKFSIYYLYTIENKPKFKPDPKLRLMEQLRQVLRYHHYLYRTEQAYCDWIIRFVKFHSKQKHPKDMGKTEIDAFLSHLATNRKVAASTQRQALNQNIRSKTLRLHP